MVCNLSDPPRKTVSNFSVSESYEFPNPWNILYFNFFAKMCPFGLTCNPKTEFSDHVVFPNRLTLPFSGIGGWARGLRQQDPWPRPQFPLERLVGLRSLSVDCIEGFVLEFKKSESISTVPKISLVFSSETFELATTPSRDCNRGQKGWQPLAGDLFAVLRFEEPIRCFMPIPISNYNDRRSAWRCDCSTASADL